MAISVEQFWLAGKDALALEIVAGDRYLKKPIPEEALNRPGLALAGFFRHFAHRRIQVLGLAENAYLKSLPLRERHYRLQQFFKKGIPCVVVTRGRHVLAEVVELTERYHVPVLKSSLITSRFINEATVLMEQLTAPQIRVQGTMVDIMGIGVLLEGPPGIGKSETALALLQRGHSLVADDVTALRREGPGSVIGTALPLTRYHMEIRGLGIVHVPSLFGVASVRAEMRLDVIVLLHRPDPQIEDDRTGLAPQERNVLGVRIPVITLPLAPGRDLANIVEAAALNFRLKQLGHDAAKELDERLMAILSRKDSSQMRRSTR